MTTPWPPREPPPTKWALPDPRARRYGDVLAIGADLEPGTLLAAYRRGIFPWPHGPDVVPWVSPDPRAVFPLDREPHWSRSLRRTLRHHPWRLSLDEAFAAVMNACGDERKDDDGGGTWITPGMLDGYTRLHALGWAHSVEVWEGADLVGGIYGVAVGGAFAGESMFHRRTDASKVAFAELARRLRASGFRIFDVQVLTPHLESLGCIEIARAEYLDRLDEVVRTPTRLE